MKEHHDSILVTLSQQTIKDRTGGYAQIIKEWQDSDGDNIQWFYKCSIAPKRPDEIINVYWVIKGRIRWKSKLLLVIKDQAIKFTTNSEPMYSKNWLVLFDFEPIPRNMQINRKGFQGFRYFDSQTIEL